MNHLQKTKRIQKFKKQEIHEVYKACFQHDIAYRDFKDLTRKRASDTILYDKVFDIIKNTIYDGYQKVIALASSF